MDYNESMEMFYDELKRLSRLFGINSEIDEDDRGNTFIRVNFLGVADDKKDVDSGLYEEWSYEDSEIYSGVIVFESLNSRYFENEGFFGTIIIPDNWDKSDVKRVLKELEGDYNHALIHIFYG